MITILLYFSFQRFHTRFKGIFFVLRNNYGNYYTLYYKQEKGVKVNPFIDKNVFFILMLSRFILVIQTLK